MQTYTREDGTQCEAVQFNGIDSVEGGDHNTLVIIEILHGAELEPRWIPEETTDEWEENEEGDDYIQVVIPEHIKILSDEVKLGDYIVKRDGDIYPMAEELFEAIYEEV